MTTFIDDFERANGALGNNWTTTAGSPVITGGSVYATANWSACQAGLTDNNYLDVTVRIARGDFSGHRGGPVVCTQGGTFAGFILSIDGTSAPYTLAIRDGGRYTGNILASYSLDEAIPPYYTLRLVWDQGYLSGYYEGRLLVQVDSSLYPDQHAAGFCGYYQGCAILDFRLVYSSALSLTAAPTIIGNYGACTDMSLTGTGTDWTPGTPGAPTFTVNHGTISAQEVLTATTANITYCPGLYLGVVTVTDPSTGEVAYFTVTSDPTSVPPPGIAGLTEYAIAMLNNTAGESLIEVLTKPNTDVQVDTETTLGLVTTLGRIGLTTGAKITPVGVPDPGLLDLLWQLVNASTDPAVGPFQHVSGRPLSEDLGELLERWDTLLTVSHYTLGDVITTLAGEGVPTHKDIMDGLNSVSFDDTAILNAIAGVKGDALATIKATLDYLFAMRTVSEYTFNDLKTWIEAVRGSGLPTVKSVLDKLALIQTGNLPDLATIDEHISTFGAITTAIDLVLGAQNKLPGTMAYVLDDVYDIVFGLQNAPPPTLNPNLWPGEENVTLGTEVPLTDGLVITGPLNGVLLTITGYPVRTQKYEFGAINSWSRVGAVIFGTDRDDYERSQTFSLDRQILIPQTMESAASATFRVNEGWEGTAMGWTRNA